QSEPQYQERKAGGSGVIISEDGYIVTNNHVVDGATKLRVKLNDGRTYDAELIGKDSATDIALLKIDEKGLPTLPFGSSDALRLGEWVLAIGSPYNLQSTITAGIVSAKARSLGALSNNPEDFSIESFIQTDAAVNPGNSGGALVNTRGELVGINTLIQSQTGSYIGYSFAVPEAIVKKVVVDLKQYGVVQRALLGIGFNVIDQNFIDLRGEETGIKEIGGIYVGSVEEGGAASEAGIRKGDILTHIDGIAINDEATLRERIARHSPNDKVKISAKREGKVKLFEVTLRNKAGKTELLTKEDIDVSETLGGKFVDASEKLCRELDIRGGVQVAGIKAEGLLARARVKEGFVITHINDRAVYSLQDLKKLTGKIRSIDGIYPNGRAASYVVVE
ncbi:MAG: trypsin-like peptidase domain-containing protein, partial [Alistipes sp.]|nr:trypsin-like peptidase domain-containing protein [Alistipes sp.]